MIFFSHWKNSFEIFLQHFIQKYLQKNLIADVIYANNTGAMT